MRLEDEQLLALWGQTKERKTKSQGIFQPKRSKWKCENEQNLHFRWFAGVADRGHTAALWGKTEGLAGEMKKDRAGARSDL